MRVARLLAPLVPFAAEHDQMMHNAHVNLWKHCAQRSSFIWRSEWAVAGQVDSRRYREARVMNFERKGRIPWHGLLLLLLALEQLVSNDLLQLLETLLRVNFLPVRFQID